MLAILGSLHGKQAAEIPFREEINFNSEWKYMRGNPDNAEKADFSDEHWEEVGLPPLIQHPTP